MLVIQRLIELEWGLRRDDARLTRGERLAEWELKARTEAETQLRVGLAWLDRAPRVKRKTPAPDWREQLSGIHGQHKRKGHHAT